MGGIYWEGVRSRPFLMAALLLLVIIICFSPLYEKMNRNTYEPEHPANILVDNQIYDGDVVELYGTIHDISLRNVNYIMELRDVAIDLQQSRGGKRNIDGYVDTSDIKERALVKLTGVGESIQVYTDDMKGLHHGQHVQARGEVEYYNRATNWGEFDAYAFNRNRGCLFKLNDSSVLWTGKEYNRMKYALWKSKCNISERIYEVYGNEDGAILNAILLGVKNEIPKEIKEAFQKSGISHILAISGLHISFLCMFVFKLCNLLGMKKWLCVTLSEMFLIIYIMMVGFSASAVRAAIMFTMYMGSILLKRSYDLITALGIALIVITSFNFMIIFDSAFQLSFLAILAIGFFWKNILDNSNILKRKLKMRDNTSISGKMHNFLVTKIAGGMLVTACISAVTLPVLIYCYYEFAFYSIILNLIIVPLMPALLIVSILGLTLTALVGNIGEIFVLLAKAILWFYKTSCIWLEQSGFGRKNIGRPDAWQIFIYYTLLVLFCLYIGRKQRFIKVLCAFMSVLIISFRTPSGIYFLDVGQGDCVVLIDEKREAYLFDGGSTSRKSIGENVIIPFLKSKGVNNIKAIFISHPDADHMNGIVELIEKGKYENLNINRICINRNLSNDESFIELIDLAMEKGIEVCSINCGEVIEYGKTKIECIYPSRVSPRVTDSKGRNDVALAWDGISDAPPALNTLADMSGNNASLVLNIKYDGITVLETGDLERIGEEIILTNSKELLDCDILKVAHHGSSSSSSREFIEAASPAISIISAGKDNRYGHPHKETIEVLEESNTTILKTAQTGAIKIVKDGKKIRVIVYKN